jgi:hypothetical protein
VKDGANFPLAMLWVTKVQVKDGGRVGMSNLSCNGTHALATFRPGLFGATGPTQRSHNQFDWVRILLRAIEVSGKRRIVTPMIDLATMGNYYYGKFHMRRLETIFLLQRAAL